jgi:hypothetical protein
MQRARSSHLLGYSTQELLDGMGPYSLSLSLCLSLSLPPLSHTTSADEFVLTQRTRDWDEFPNGRWGDSSSPAYGDLSGYYLFTPPSSTASQELKKAWGEPTSVADVSQVFVSFITGDGRVKTLPWAEGELESETTETSNLHRTLVNLNSNGILTINSQPATNGVPSTDPIHGWGGSNGYIYKKAYLEFFCSPQIFQLLLDVMRDFPMMTYHALNASGTENHTNSTSVCTKSFALLCVAGCCVLNWRALHHATV